MSGGPGTARLAVRVDGVWMEEEAARDMWQRFSAHMEANRGDLAGFARSVGYASVHPRSEGGRAVLELSGTAPQEAYGVVPSPDAKRAKPTRR